ncbi:AraC family transcriptional regulator [Paenibacillus sp. Marseille-Q4541]|uniref:AraC family transcriptional regulator n=1 Tax=Paenibacillus sp. Marseille-Q4541 TaxID=2831522 RepID=UPI001BA46924|nr:AraC family transcriptional regulator [Paenibacillus sp. Marseille-Q4541]
MSIDTLSFVQSFKRANSELNHTLNRIDHPDLAIKIHYWGFMPRHFDNSEHKHSFFEACYVLSGEGFYIDGSNEYSLHPGTLFLSRPGIQHQIKSTEGLSLCYIAFETVESACSEIFNTAFQLLAEQANPVVREEGAKPTELLWLSLVSLFSPSSSGGSAPPLAITLNSMAMSLILSLLTAHGPGFYIEPHEKKRNDEGTSMIHQAELFIKDNISRSLSLELVAGHLHITSRHLTRLFRKYGHQSFVHYVQEQRVQRAKDLLLHSDHQIKEIATLCGFESIHYFTRVFSIKIGVTPARFRRTQFTEGRFDSNL